MHIYFTCSYPPSRMPSRHELLQVHASPTSHVDRSRIQAALYRQQSSYRFSGAFKMKKRMRDQKSRLSRRRILAKYSWVVQRGPMNSIESRDDLAARVAWMHFLEKKTQQEIAAGLDLSRPTVNRLIAYATKRGLVTVRVNHPLAECVKLAEQLRTRFNLSLCEVAPLKGTFEGSPIRPIAAVGSTVFERYLA